MASTDFQGKKSMQADNKLEIFFTFTNVTNNPIHHFVKHSYTIPKKNARDVNSL